MGEDSPTGDIPQTPQQPPLGEGVVSPPQGDPLQAAATVPTPETPVGAEAYSVPGEQAAEAAPATPDQSTAESAPEDAAIKGANRVTEEGKAEVMAYAEDDFRSKAAASRKLAQPSKELLDKAVELYEVTDNLQNKAPQQFSTLQRLRMKDKQPRLAAEITDMLLQDMNQETKARRSFSRDFSSARHPDGPPAYAERMTDASERAKYYDEEASRIGDWAGALHDQPLSKEFLEAHPELSSDPEETAKRLVHLEDNRAALERIIARSEKTSRVTVRANLAAMLENVDRSGRMASPQMHELDELLAQKQRNI
jgi:hypothetical protein